ncbi:MAG TPA: hypothetical protein PLJ27_22430, partial [Polyangiaceae bacterium]|nr:hypothetical protein [Polyangiaceae bacterium]
DVVLGRAATAALGVSHGLPRDDLPLGLQEGEVPTDGGSGELEWLIAVGFGDLKPVADNKTDEGRAQNRRTEFIVVEVGNKPWLGADTTAGGTVFGENPR